MLIFAVSLTLCTVVASPEPAVAQAQPAASREVFESLVLARIRAFGRGDIRSYQSLISQDFVHVSDAGTRRTAKQLRDYIASGRSAGTTFSVRNLSFKLRGKLALVDCEVVETTAAGSGRQREVNVFEARGRRWVYVMHSETMIQEKDVSAVAIDPATLQQYVGRYAFAGGTDIMSSDRTQLFVKDSPASEPTPLIPIAANTFVLRGDPSVIIFERNQQGTVVGYAVRGGNGRVIRAAKAR